MKYRTLPASFIVASSLFGLAACGSTDSTSTPDAPSEITALPPVATDLPVVPATDVPVEVFELPRDPDALLMSVIIGRPSGQTPVNDISITADGRVFIPVDRPQGYQPPPATEPKPFVVRQLTDAGLDAIVSAATEERLFSANLEYDDAGITDQGFTTVTLNSQTTTIAHHVYALEFEADSTAGEANRVILRSFVDQLLSLRSMEDHALIGDAVAFTPATWTVASYEGWFDFDVDGDGEDDGRTWPLAPDLVGPCVDLDESSFDGAVAGQYYVAETKSGDERSQVTVVEVVPAFPWVDCES